MALRYTIKLGNVTNLSDARYGAGMGVEMIGIPINPQADNFVHPNKVREISEWIAGVSFVAECEGIENKDLSDVLGNYDFGVIQLDGNQLESINQLSNDTQLLIKLNPKACRTNIEILKELYSQKRLVYIILETDNDEDKIDDLSIPILITGDLELSTFENQIEFYSAKGFELKGSVEERPGFKNFDSIADFLERVEVDD